MPKSHIICAGQNVMSKFVKNYENVMYIKKIMLFFLNLIYLILKFVTVIRLMKKIIFAYL